MSKLPFKPSSNVVEQWASNLPLASTLTLCLRPATTLEEVAALTTEQIDEICKLFSDDLKETLQTNCSLLNAALATETSRQSNSKFGTFNGNFGTISNFHTQLYEEIGNPNPNWEKAMRWEHVSNIDTFTTGNYNLTTCPKTEWSYVVDGVSPPAEAMGYGRTLQPIDSLMALEMASKAALTRPEVIALTLYTGPMFVIYNTILPIQKVSRVMVLQPGQCLYRGVDGNMNLPEHFTKPDLHGCLGMMEFGFMSTTADLSVAVEYTNVAKGRAHPKVLEIRIGSVDRGADIHQFSQYPGEAEYLWAPHAFLEPMGGNNMLVTEHGMVEVIPVRVNSNLKAVTLEEYQGRKKEMHMASFKMLVQDLTQQLEKHLRRKDVKIPRLYDADGAEMKISQQEKAKHLISSIMAECEEIRGRQAALGAAEFNDDTVYRGLVTQMLDMQMHAQEEMEWLLAKPSVWTSTLALKSRAAFRDRIDDIWRGLKRSPAPDANVAVNLCKKRGLLRKNVREVNELKETPLIAACADGVPDEPWSCY